MLVVRDEVETGAISDRFIKGPMQAIKSQLWVRGLRQAHGAHTMHMFHLSYGARGTGSSIQRIGRGINLIPDACSLLCVDKC